MNPLNHLLFAASDPGVLQDLTGGTALPSRGVFRDSMLVIGVGVGLGLVLLLAVLVWRSYFRKGSRAQETHHWDGEEEDEDSQHNPSRRKRKRKRLRREHRPRNPTLAETGGLPPLRSDPPGGTPH